MNKKYLMFGMMGLFVMAIVSAGLVNYLSNTVEANVEVSSPVVQYIATEESDLDDSEGDVIDFDIKGGESSEFYVRDQNLASIPIVGYSDNVITNPSGVTCDDFISVVVTTTTQIGDGAPAVSGPHDLIAYGFCSQVNPNEVRFDYGPNPNTLAVGQVDTSKIVVTFEPNALGEYTYTSVVNLA